MRSRSDRQDRSRALIPPDRPDEGPEILPASDKGERVEHFETVRRRKDGTLLDISLTISPVLDANGQIIGASKIARDISEQINAPLRRSKHLTHRLVVELDAMTRIQQLRSG